MPVRSNARILRPDHGSLFLPLAVVSTAVATAAAGAAFETNVPIANTMNKMMTVAAYDNVDIYNKYRQALSDRAATIIAGNDEFRTSAVDELSRALTYAMSFTDRVASEDYEACDRTHVRISPFIICDNSSDASAPLAVRCLGWLGSTPLYRTIRDDAVATIDNDESSYRLTHETFIRENRLSTLRLRLRRREDVAKVPATDNVRTW